MLYLAADKHGFKAIKFVEKYLRDNNVPFVNLGVKNAREDIALEVMIPRVVRKIKKNKANRAILSCGTGVGVQVGANKFKGVRACLATDKKVAKWSRVYDNCNILCLAGWGSTRKSTSDILSSWLSSKYDGNKSRLKMLRKFDSWR